MFGTPANVTEINAGSINTEDPTLTDDLLEIFFSSTRTGGAGGVDIWTSTRGSVTASWSTPVLVTAASGTNDDTTPEITGDGLALVFASNRPGGAGAYDLYELTRPSRAAAWGAPVRIVELASTTDEFAGSLSPDRLTIVFASSRSGGPGGGDVFEATRPTSASTWGTPTPIANINSAADDSAPWRSADGLVLLISSTRSGGQGAQDVWLAERASTAAPWGVPTPIAELNGPDYDSDPWLSPDRRTMVYSRLEGAARNVFTATR
jgi:Tol biopolymer transport system component